MEKGGKDYRKEGVNLVIKHNRDQILFHKLCPMAKVLNRIVLSKKLNKQLVLKGLVRI